MKPCSKHRKKIAWLTLNALDAAEERDLRTHLESCPPCRAYWKEVSSLTGKLSSARQPANLEASESFHQQVIRAVRDQSQGLTDGLFARWHSVAWRVALPVVGVVAVVVAVFSLGLWRPQNPPKSSAAPHSRATIRVDLEPTVFNYQMAANASLDGLDELLTSQGNRNLPPAPRFPGPVVAGATTME
jgi:anti-sigma factor RsiW